MNKIKSLLLGSAATLIAVTGAQAADMPLTPAREPVYQCDIAGFYEIPGSDICLRISGFARFWMGGQNRDGVTHAFVDGGNTADVVANEVFGPINPVLDVNDADPFFMSADFRVRFDARSATSLGTVRAFAELQAEDDNGNTGGALELRQAFVQVGNWVFGKTGSTFTVNRTGANYTNAISTLDAVTIRIVQVRYTVPFGNGFALSVAIEDPSYEEPTDGTLEVAANEFPNFVANLAYTGDRVAASLGGVLVYNDYFDGADTSDELGWAIQGSVEFSATDLLILGLLGTYSDGTSEYAPDLLGGGDNIAMDGFGNVLREVEIWSVGGFITAQFTPEFAANLIVGYGERDGADSADLELFSGTVNVVYTPVDNLEFILEFTYANEDVSGEEDFLGVFQAVRSF